MTSHLDMGRYNVFTTTQFEDLWQRALSNGFIDPLVGSSQLEELISFLSADPYYFPLIDTAGEPVDLRRLNFISGGPTRVEIWYSVVEDDKAVYLVTVEVILPAQQTFPGFGV